MPRDRGPGEQSSTTLNPGTSAPLGIKPVTLGPSDVSDILNLKKDFYIVGWVRYVDSLGNSRETSFCRRLRHDKPRRFVPIDDPDYEYAD